MKKKTPTLSIITICYNIKDEIERTCESIVNQTWQDFEWIVVDGGSTDGTIEVLKKYKKRINILISEPDKGVYNAMNKGIKLAHGQWLSFMNGGDCYYADDVLEKVFKNKKYNADILYGWQYFAKSKQWRKYTENLTLEWMCSNALGHQAMFIQKSCFDKYGLYDESFRIVADFEHNVCFKKNGCKFKYLPFGIAWFAEDGISSSRKYRDVFTSELLKIYERYYTREEVLKYGRSCCKSILKSGYKIQCKLFNIVPLFSKITKRNVCTYALLGVPLLRKERSLSPNITKIKLFGFIPLYSVCNKNISPKNITLPIKDKYPRSTYMHFKTYDNLVEDIRNNIGKISENIQLVVGVPRSGMIPAYIIGQIYNCNVCSIDEFINGLYGKKGMTRNVNDDELQNILVIDDSISSGQSMMNVKQKLQKYQNKYNIKYAAVYAQPASKDIVDYYLTILPGYRVFEWNYLNHHIVTKSCFDIDGVLCVDPTPEQNDDGEKYIEFLRSAQPLYIPKYKIRALVTSRLEKYRFETEKWLKEHGVLYDKLYMLDVATAEERRKQNLHAIFKSDVYSSLPDCEFFYESERNQAISIHNATGKIVFCVSTSEIFE